MNQLKCENVPRARRPTAISHRHMHGLSQEINQIGKLKKDRMQLLAACLKLQYREMNELYSEKSADIIGIINIAKIFPVEINKSGKGD